MCKVYSSVPGRWMITLVNRDCAAPTSRKLWGPWFTGSCPSLCTYSLQYVPRAGLLKRLLKYRQLSCLQGQRQRWSQLLFGGTPGVQGIESNPALSSVARLEVPALPSSEEGDCSESGLHLSCRDHSESGPRLEGGFFAEWRQALGAGAGHEARRALHSCRKSEGELGEESCHLG